MKVFLKKLIILPLFLLLTPLFGQTFSTGEIMVRIPSGTFTMGSPANEPNRWDREGPQRRVTISSFFMSRNPVTVAEFRRFIEASGYYTDAERDGGGSVIIGGDWVLGGHWVHRADANWRNPYFQQGDNHPVVLISWFDAIEYCNWLSSQEGLTPAYTISGYGDNRTVTWNKNANGYRLPTEAEWEYACRAGTTTVFNTGVSITINQANFNNILGGTIPVGSFTANAWGLHDMHGNVWEWCWDWFGAYPSGVQTDPEGASSGAFRVIRGGCWGSSSAGLRSAYRGGFNPSIRFSHFGFRLVRNAQ
jgi:formylglycine-generating enzyme required for sulfatase activity